MRQHYTLEWVRSAPSRFASWYDAKCCQDVKPHQTTNEQSTYRVSFLTFKLCRFLRLIYVVDTAFLIGKQAKVVGDLGTGNTYGHIRTGTDLWRCAFMAILLGSITSCLHWANQSLPFINPFNIPLIPVSLPLPNLCSPLPTPLIKLPLLPLPVNP